MLIVRRAQLLITFVKYRKELSYKIHKIEIPHEGVGIGHTYVSKVVDQNGMHIITKNAINKAFLVLFGSSANKMGPPTFASLSLPVHISVSDRNISQTHPV